MPFATTVNEWIHFILFGGTQREGKAKQKAMNKGNRLTIRCPKIQRSTTCQVKTNPASRAKMVTDPSQSRRDNLLT